MIIKNIEKKIFIVAIVVVAFLGGLAVGNRVLPKPMAAEEKQKQQFFIGCLLSGNHTPHGDCFLVPFLNHALWYVMGNEAC